MLHILDYSWARPSPQSIVDYPAVGVMRYLGPGTKGRDITRAELESLWTAGLGVGFVWETEANAVLGGYNVGRDHAGQADYHASILGIPDECPIYYASDCDVDPHETWGAVKDYYAGTLCSVHPSRSYGEADVLDMVADEFGMRHGWQPAATSWSDGRLSVNASMHQRWPYVMNDQCDDNDVLCPSDQIDWLWKGDDMGLSSDDLHQIKNVVAEVVNDAMNKNYANSRAVCVEGEPEVWEIVTANGERYARYIPTPEQQRMFQWADVLAGPRDQAPRVLTDPDDIAAFKALPKIGYPGGDEHPEHDGR